MDKTMSNEFSMMTVQEEELFNGGDWLEAGGVFLGSVAVAWSPVVGFFCPPAGVGMALGGLGLIGKGTGAY